MKIIVLKVIVQTVVFPRPGADTLAGREQSETKLLFLLKSIAH
jgi:hypothetical protein